VQSTLGRWILNDQLRVLGILADGERLEDHKDFWHVFRNGELRCAAWRDARLTPRSLGRPRRRRQQGVLGHGRAQD
jgi:hypothetical protein